MSLIYGPVPSWRLGRSLGVDAVSTPSKTCSFDCIYCQLGRTRHPSPADGGTKSGWSDRCSSNLPNGVARIDQDRCNECEACVEACPNEAILVVIEPVEEKALSLHEQPAPEVTLAEPHRTNVVPVVGAALAFLGREVAPRLVTYLVDALDRRWRFTKEWQSNTTKKCWIISSTHVT